MLMFLKKLDFLSPDITLYHKGDHSHSSWMSGILSLIQVAIMIFVTIYYSLDLINHREPKSYFYYRFIENAGFYPLNASSFFHFISIVTQSDAVTEYSFDFLSFRIIGFDTYYARYIENPNLTNIDHWLYGKCDKFPINEQISDLLNSKKIKNYENYGSFACIKKFYDTKTEKYYDIGEEKFHWPNISYGLSNPKRSFYSIVIERCSQKTLDTIFGEGLYECKDNNKIKSYLDGHHAFHMNFINQDVDVLDYKDPNKQYFYNIENAIDGDNYSINHINLNPVLITTHYGIVTDRSKEEMSFTFERNDEFTYNVPNSNIFCMYNLWLKNRMQCYDRTYKKIQDVISNIGGVAQGITYIAVFLNCLFNKYVEISNVGKIIIPYLKIEETDKKLGINNKLDEMQKKMIKCASNANLNNNFAINTITSEIKSTSNNNDEACFHDSISNKYKNNETQIISKEDEIKIHYNNLFQKKFNFWYYRLYKLTCGKKKNYFKNFEEFRIKIISEENIIKNHLYIFNFIKMSEINSINRSFSIEELIKN